MQQTVAIVGGTGAEGSGLALRFAKAGARVSIGSRTLDKAQSAAERIAAAAGAGEVTGHANPDSVAAADLVVLTVPLAAQAEILKSVRASFRPGAVLVDATVPLEIAIGGRISRTLTLWDGSAAQHAARLVPEGVRVVAAFHALSADALIQLDQPVDCDVLMCGDDADAKTQVRGLASLIPGVRTIDAGPLDNARLLETTAALLISLNLRYKQKSSGLRITGIDPHGVSR